MHRHDSLNTAEIAAIVAGNHGDPFAFLGMHLYEHADPREGVHKDWDTLIYNYGRNEVKNYLIGNALYWIERFGIDGLRAEDIPAHQWRHSINLTLPPLATLFLAWIE